MKKIWGKLILLLTGVLALAGINPFSAQANVQYDKQIAEVRETTPLFLKLGVNILSNYNNQNNNIKLAGHYSHSSHESHYSHSSHRSHYSG